MNTDTNPPEKLTVDMVTKDIEKEIIEIDRRERDSILAQERNVKTNTDPWSSECPTTPGTYEFKCAETDYEIETVPVILEPSKGLFATMDNLCNPVGMWHDGLTDPQWRLKAGESHGRNFKKI